MSIYTVIVQDVDSCWDVVFNNTELHRLNRLDNIIIHHDKLGTSCILTGLECYSVFQTVIYILCKKLSSGGSILNEYNIAK